jgi:quinoprotein glucose dehydrogenase
MPRPVSRPLALLALSAAASAALLTAAPVPPPPAFNPPVAGASDQGQKAIARFRVPAGVTAELFAAEPLLANPVCFAFDHKGRCYVAETFRHTDGGATDNRSHMYWLDDDLASRTVADRVAMFRKHLGPKFADYEKLHDRVRRVVDTDGDGVADAATVFADGFHKAADGIGAGLLAHGDDVFFTCIPDLWRLRDTTGKGVADERESLATGFGVHVAFIGHDLHGLRIGPDGRLYFSVGDRGMNVTTREGRRLMVPDTGAVIRCELDGSNMEVFATGLRNPQELAFDAHGNLFTGDNNCDSGDRARWVHLVAGSDSGWRIGYQYGCQANWGPGTKLGNRGPWNSERIWETPNPEQPAYVVPPVALLGNGPSGLCAHPGVAALPDDQVGHFYLADFRGGSGGSGVWSLAMRPKGAGFELQKPVEYLWSILGTDVDFGPDGGLYVSDWVEGWAKPGKGRIYRFAAPDKLKSAAVREVKALLAEGMAKRPGAELEKLLGHADARVRTEAQLTLAGRGKEGLASFEDVARKGPTTPARLHGVWGLGMLARRGVNEALPPLASLLADTDPDIRAQAAVAVGESAWGAPDGMLALLADPEPRVRMHAALALKSGVDGTHHKTEVGRVRTAVTRLLRENADREPLLRHAGALALSALPAAELLKSAGDESAAVRMGVLLALRRQGSPEVARFLTDADERLVIEAARAVNDVPVEAALPKLAALAGRPSLPEPLGFRVLNAHFRLGKSENAAAVASLAARPGLAEVLRIEAVKMLADWGTPGRRDRVTGLTMSLPARDAGPAADAFRGAIAAVFAAPEKVRTEAVKAAARLGIKEVGPVLFALAGDAKLSASVRAEALAALDAVKDGRTDEAVSLGLKADAPEVRSAARRVLARRKPSEAVPVLKEALASGTLGEKQSALAVLGGLTTPDAAAVVTAEVERLAAGKVPPELRLDVVEAAGQRGDLKKPLAAYAAARPKDDPLRDWRDSLVGGNAERGRQLFLAKAELACQRCHKVQGQGGEVGPELAGIGGKQPREYLLEAIVLPSKQIAKGFETVVIATSDGKTVTGVLKGEDAKEVRLVTAEGKAVAVPKADIDERQSGPSAMPADLTKHLTPRELRDLVEFLASLKEAKP